MRDPLEWENVGADLVTSGQPWRGVEFHAAIGSTNTRLHELVIGAASPQGPYADRPDALPSGPPDGLPTGTPAGPWWVVLTDHQTGGRGRLGRVWEVPDRASIAVSCAIPVTGPRVAGWLPLLAGLAVTRALRAVTRAAGHEVDPRLKWPNDVLLGDDGDRKVSGILSELVAVPAPPGLPGAPARPVATGADDVRTRDAAYVVIVGTGVNVDQTREELPVDSATSLALAGARVRREDVVAAYLHELAALLGLSGPGGDRTSRAADFRVGSVDRSARAEYVATCSTVGAHVRVHLPGGEAVEGEAVDIDPDGGLVVETARGRRSFAAGDVVHVRRP